VRTCSAIPLALAFILTAEARGGERPFAFRVIDSATGRGVPLVELRTVSGARFVTDSGGVVAFAEPGLWGQEVFLHIRSHGYEYPADGFGNRGVRVRPTPGGSARVELKRVNIAERLYRITGEGIYRDSFSAGLSVPIKEPLLNAQVTGQDSVQMAEYRGRLWWLWGDTNRASYPLGHFGTAGATSLLPSRGGLEPDVGVDLTYFTRADGFSRPMCAVPGKGMKWMDALITVSDARGRERLVARYVRMKSLGEELERGFAILNDEKKVFEPLSVLKPDDLKFGCAHAFRHRERDGAPEHVYFTYPYAAVRVRADLESFKDVRKYEAFTCLEGGARYRKGDSRLDRDAGGRLVWAWKCDAAPLSDGQWEELVKFGKVKPDEAWNLLRDAASGKRVRAHTGTVAWNDYRRRWIMVLCQEHGGPSYLGEVWYAEAERLEGPWRRAVKIVTHDRYSFYNVKHHSIFDRRGGREIYFEGTYTAQFSGNKDRTPRYDYNQIMYRLDLEDERLEAAHAATAERLPLTVDEAVDHLLPEIPDIEKLALKRGSKMEVLKLHHGFGTWIRNEILRNNMELVRDCERRAGRKFRGYFLDSASGVILDALWERLQTLPLEDEESASRIWMMAENYLLSDAWDPARFKLRELIEKYPDTGHADLARAKLKELAGEDR
jgi:hypothetical protein